MVRSESLERSSVSRTWPRASAQRPVRQHTAAKRGRCRATDAAGAVDALPTAVIAGHWLPSTASLRFSSTIWSSRVPVHVRGLNGLPSHTTGVVGSGRRGESHRWSLSLAVWSQFLFGVHGLCDKSQLQLAEQRPLSADAAEPPKWQRQRAQCPLPTRMNPRKRSLSGAE